MRKKITLFLCIFTILFQFLAVFYSVIVALPTNPLSLDKNKTEFIQNYLSQGWGFYSKDPTEPELNIYDLEGEDQLVWPNNRMKNLFGLYRYGRAQGTEMGLLQSQIPQESWIDCEDNALSCLLEAPSIIVENKTPNPTLCGEFGVTLEESIPWSWSKHAEKINMPSEVVRMSVKCSGN